MLPTSHPAEVPGAHPDPITVRSGDWRVRQLDDLVEAIARQDHAWLRGELKRLDRLFAEILPHRVEDHFALSDLYTEFTELVAAIWPHLVREETILFPLVTTLQRRETSGGAFDTLAEPIAHLRQDHRELLVLVDRLESARRKVRPAPQDPSVTRLLDALNVLGATLRAQMAREDEYLFPRVTALEETVLGETRTEGGI